MPIEKEEALASVTDTTEFNIYNNINKIEEEVQWELVTCDTISVIADAASFVFPPTMIISIIASGTGLILTNNDYNEGRATVKDADTTFYTFIPGLIPWAGINPGFYQLMYDLKVTK